MSRMYRKKKTLVRSYPGYVLTFGNGKVMKTCRFLSVLIRQMSLRKRTFKAIMTYSRGVVASTLVGILLDTAVVVGLEKEKGQGRGLCFVPVVRSRCLLSLLFFLSLVSGCHLVVAVGGVSSNVCPATDNRFHKRNNLNGPCANNIHTHVYSSSHQNQHHSLFFCFSP